MPASPASAERPILRHRHLALALALLLPALVLAAVLWLDALRLGQAAEARAARQAEAAAAQALAALRQADEVLATTVTELRPLRWPEIEASSATSLFLTRTAAQHDHVRGAGLVRPDGRLAAVSDMFPAPEVDLSARDYVADALRQPEATHISSVVRGQLSGQRLFRLSRAHADAAGARGVAFVSLSPVNLERLFAAGLREGEAVLLARDDGTPLAVAWRGEPEVGRALPEEDRPPLLLEERPGGAGPVLARHRVGSYPVQVLFGIDRDHIVAEWQANARGYALAALFAALTLAALVLLAVRHAREEQALLARCAEEAARRAEADRALEEARQRAAASGLTPATLDELAARCRAARLGAEAMVRDFGWHPTLLLMAKQVLTSSERAGALAERLRQAGGSGMPPPP